MKYHKNLIARGHQNFNMDHAAHRGASCRKRQEVCMSGSPQPAARRLPGWLAQRACIGG